MNVHRDGVHFDNETRKAMSRRNGSVRRKGARASVVTVLLAAAIILALCCEEVVSRVIAQGRDVANRTKPIEQIIESQKKLRIASSKKEETSAQIFNSASNASSLVKRVLENISTDASQNSMLWNKRILQNGNRPNYRELETTNDDENNDTAYDSYTYYDSTETRSRELWCSGAAPMDVVFVFDQSLSISDTSWDLIRNFAADFVETLTVGSDNSSSKVSAVTYATEARKVIHLNNGIASDSTRLTTKLRSLSRMSESVSRYTYIWSGIQNANDMISRHGREAAKPVVIFISDGMPENNEEDDDWNGCTWTTEDWTGADGEEPEGSDRAIMCSRGEAELIQDLGGFFAYIQLDFEGANGITQAINDTLAKVLFRRGAAPFQNASHPYNGIGASVQSTKYLRIKENATDLNATAVHTLIMDHICPSDTTDTPTQEPTFNPTPYPTMLPTPYPVTLTTSRPTSRPTAEPTVKPTTAEPTPKPTSYPTPRPSPNPTMAPTRSPTAYPTLNPTAIPTGKSTPQPSVMPTAKPTTNPTSISTTDTPTITQPTEQPTTNGSSTTPQPTIKVPTREPTVSSSSPTSLPTLSPPTSSPTSCLVYGEKYNLTVNNVLSTPALVSSAVACKAVCQLSTTCMYFTYNISEMSCYLKTQLPSSSDISDDADFISGPPYCNTESSTDSPTVSSDCFEYSSQYPLDDNNLYSNPIEGIESAEGCQEFCSWQSDCEYFSYCLSEELCYLKTEAPDNGTELITDDDYVSGSQQCADSYTAPTASPSSQSSALSVIKSIIESPYTWVAIGASVIIFGAVLLRKHNLQGKDPNSGAIIVRQNPAIDNSRLPPNAVAPAYVLSGASSGKTSTTGSSETGGTYDDSVADDSASYFTEPSEWNSKR